MAFRILINREESEVRVAFMDGQDLVELHTEKFDEQTIVNNIYRGKVQDVVPGLQAAFIDVGLERNMFLHFMDIRPESLVLGEENQAEAIREASKKSIPGRIELKGRRPRQDPNAPQAESPVRKGDDIIVQVMKDEIGGKAPRVTANISLAGRYLVMLPFPSQEGGVSRKIAVGQDRFRLKKLLAHLKTEDHSFIVRTAGLEQDEEPIRNDAESLMESWHQILKTYKQRGKPGLLRNDHNLLTRLVRDAFPPNFNEVICDNPADADEVRILLSHVMPDKEKLVKTYEGRENIFEHYDVEKQIEHSLAQKYWLKSGGYLIIDENEALTAIDVNTGRFTGKRDQEKTSLRTNTEACEAIARQIRLRDIGGIIVIDFIDMLSRAHQERVSEELRRQLRNDRAKTAIGRIGDFGLMVLTRKRQRMSLQNQVFDPCPYCSGTGLVMKHEEVFRKLKYDIYRAIDADRQINSVIISAHPRMIDSLTSHFRTFFDRLKSAEHCDVVYRADPDMHLEDFQITPLKKMEGEGLRLRDDRIGPEARILPPIVEVTHTSVAAVVEAGTAEDSTQPLVEADDESKPRRKRRRESSAERRARRRRLREIQNAGEGTEQDAAFDDANDDEYADDAFTTDREIPEDMEILGEIPDVEASLGEEPQREDNTDEQEGQRKRTRRGSRGGRRRGKRGAERLDAPDAVKQQEEPKATEQTTAKPDLGPLKLPITRSKDADLFDSMLNEIEKAVESLPGNLRTTGKPAVVVAAPVVITKESAVTADMIEQLAAAVAAEREKDQPSTPKKKPMRKPAPAKPKKTPATPAKPTKKPKAVESRTLEPKKAKAPARKTAAAKKAAVAPKAEPPKPEEKPKRTTRARKTTKKGS